MSEIENISRYLSISDFTKVLKENIENAFPYVFLRGEISNFRPASSGHWYFSLKDKASAIRAIIFKNSQSSILNALSTSNISMLKDGQEVLAEGRLSLYERSGDYSIIITKLIPLGAGELAVKFEMLKQKLQAEGLFDKSIKKELPKFPAKIGIVTSPTGAALKDILNVLKRRFASISVTVFPALVQGENAKEEIIRAIKFADYHYRKNLPHKCDVLILARGGGSIEDLWCFNEEEVAYAIHETEIPVITGIGHEIDFTIADFCADFRAPTPSAAAEIVVKDSEELINSVASMKLRVEVAFNNYLERLNSRFERGKPERLINIFQRILQNNEQDYSYLTEKMNAKFNENFNSLKVRFSHLAGKLESISPLKILGRGYSLVIDKESRLIKSHEAVKIGDNLSVILSKGELEVKVDKILEKSGKI
jgi:exodeoxyribonuclease VII large subunit